MKKNLIILIVTLLIICLFAGYFIINYRYSKMDAQINNKEYIAYYDKTIQGTDIVTLINKTVDRNEKNNILKDDNKNYIENDINSIKIYIKFNDSKENYTMEQIYNKDTENFIKYYASNKFICINIEYHKKTGNVKNLTFQEEKV